ncbi:hypothetical protein Fot_03323 [Forsythia ovata]|uniref:Uncharacterized protein n=1 Tax=Forsythia ovata TaxID=205694 RepID=A0ABD1X9F2_9LAMI
MSDHVEKLNKTLKLHSRQDEEGNPKHAWRVTWNLWPAQMLEMQRQQATQTAVLNVYLQQGFMPPAPSVYPSYRLEGHEDRLKDGEYEDYYSNASLTQPEILLQRNEEVDPFQYQNQRNNMEENYKNPNLLSRYSQELETSQASSVFDRFGRQTS